MNAGPGPGRILAIGAMLLVTATVAFTLGSASGERPSARVSAEPSPGPIVWRQQIPVGVQDTPAAALAFADNYLSVEQTTMEAKPAMFAELVAQDDAPEYRATDTRQVAQLRRANPKAVSAWQRGGRGVWLIAAHHMDSFTGQAAQVTIWNGGLAWGGGFTPQQNWALTAVSMRWAHGQWWVTRVADRPESAPIPSATPQATRRNTTAEWFSARLAGFTTVAVQ